MMMETTDTNSEHAQLAGKRVLIIFPHIVTAGGALHYTLRLAEQLQKEGAKVAILALQVARSAFPTPEGVELICLDGPLTSQLRYWLMFPFWQRKINQAVSCWRADVLVPQVFPANWWGWFYKKHSRTAKIAWVCHEPSAFIHSLPWIKALRPKWMSIAARLLRPALAATDVSLVRYSDRIIANSQFTADEVKKVYHREVDAVAYPGIELQPNGRQKERTELAIITVARLTKFKRVDFLLQVFSGLLKSHPALKYHIVGTGEEADSLRQMVGKLGLKSQVVFYGAASDKKLGELYNDATLFLHGSVNEPFGMAPLEAIACGTPVVAHDSGGPREFVDENCGRLIPSLQVDDWVAQVADYLDLLVANPGLHKVACRSAQRFEWQATLRPAVDTIARLTRDG
ncbi:MAG: glycosyltransferase family 4 protein [Desulfuromusa sp.]|nr:glycosyltransferase family 4 protein [Desulfuromusa sp.]